jgi:hypothetical protein
VARRRFNGENDPGPGGAGNGPGGGAVTATIWRSRQSDGAPTPIRQAEGPFPGTVEGTIEEGARALTIRIKRGAARLSTVVLSSPQ